MGVIYKLKDDIVQFILQKKQEESSISCRRLADIIQETFKISVSKSSINTIIKEAHLSNPVGRTPLKTKTPAFKIPQEKKSELYQKTKPNLEDALGIEASSLLASPPPKPSLPSPTETSVSLGNKENFSEKVIETEKKELQELNTIDVPARMDATLDAEPQLSLIPDPLAANNLEAIQSFEETQLGNLLLRFALWDLTRRPLLESFFKHRTNFSDEEIKIIDTLVCFWDCALDSPQTALKTENLWLWSIAEFEEPPTLKDIEAIIDRLKTTNIDTFEFSLETSYFFEFISKIKLLLNDKTVVNLDSRLTRITSEVVNTCPVDRAVENISQFIAEPGKPIILHCSQPEGLTEIENFIALCKCLPAKSIEKILFLDEQEKIVSEFSIPACFERGYILTTNINEADCKSIENRGLGSEFQKVLYKNEEIYWSQRKYTFKIDNRDVETKMFAFTKSQPFLSGKALFVSPELKLSISTLLEILFQPEVTENKKFKIITSDLSSNSTDSLKNCLVEFQKKTIAYMQQVFMHEELKEIDMLNNERISLKIENFNDVIKFYMAKSPLQKLFNSTNIQELINIINSYNICNYQQKSLKIIINNT